MTRDEVLEEAARAAEVYGRHMEDRYCVNNADGDGFAGAIRALKSRPPEKSPEVERASNLELVTRWRDRREGVKHMSPIELAALGNVLCDAADATALRAERDALRRELSQFDCRRTGGPVSDVDGIHCPPEAPCMRCRLRRAEEKLAAQTKAAEEALARVKHIEWVQAGSKMLGET